MRTRRIYLVLEVATVISAMLLGSAVPALADSHDTGEDFECYGPPPDDPYFWGAMCYSQEEARANGWIR